KLGKAFSEVALEGNGKQPWDGSAPISDPADSGYKRCSYDASSGRCAFATDVGWLNGPPQFWSQQCADAGIIHFGAVIDGVHYRRAAPRRGAGAIKRLNLFLPRACAAIPTSICGAISQYAARSVCGRRNQFAHSPPCTPQRAPWVGILVPQGRQTAPCR